MHGLLGSLLLITAARAAEAFGWGSVPLAASLRTRGVLSSRNVVRTRLCMNKALQRPNKAASDAPSVALIGGGISGLACANRLQELGLQATVFDTGKRAVGGRVSSRVLTVQQEGASKPVHVPVDHSTQFFTATDPRFRELVSQLEERGAVSEWKGPVGTLENGSFTVIETPEKKWVGRGSMSAVPKALANDLRVVTDCWVASVERQHDTGKWRLWRDKNRRQRLSAGETPASDFDYLVVAHNGKCAEALMRQASVPKLHRLLKTKFSCAPPPTGLMQLSSLWVMTFVVDKPLGLDFEGAFVSGQPDLCWVADNTKKLASSTFVGGLEAWTVISSRSFGSRNKVPQEAVPREVEERVAGELLRAFESAAGLPAKTINPVSRKLQLWGAGVPMNVFRDAPCVFDAGSQAGICGDWLLEPSVQGAALSGMALADAIARHASGQSSDDVGIPTNPDTCMRAVSSPACGVFPGLSIPDSEPALASLSSSNKAVSGGGHGKGAGPGGGTGRDGRGKWIVKKRAQATAAKAQ